MSEHPRKVVVTGRALVGGAGTSLDDLHQTLHSGESPAAPIERFDVAGLGCNLAAELTAFDARKELAGANLRPLDRAGQIAVVVAQRALENSGWTPEKREEKIVGLAYGTMFGSVNTISEFDRRALTAGPKYAKPMAFANTVINAPAGQVAIFHGLRGLNSTLAAGTASGLQALGYATDQIRAGRYDALLAGGGDELCFESYHGFYRCGWSLGANGAEPCAVPFDARRNGFLPAEGAALVMLEDQVLAEERGATILAEVRGYGNSFDPERGADPDSARKALVRAIHAALADAGLDSTDAIDVVVSSADGSVLGDRAEAAALAEVCGGEVPVTAPTGALGQTLGGSAAFQALTLLDAMQHGKLPGVAGLQQPDDDLAVSVAAESRDVDARLGLLTGLGLDGNACALLIERRDG